MVDFDVAIDQSVYMWDGIRVYSHTNIVKDKNKEDTSEECYAKTV